MGKLLTIIICMLAVQNAAAQDKNDAIWKDINGVRDVTLDSLEKANQVRPVSGSSRKGDNPVLFLVGNSTKRNGTLGNGNNGQWGWGYYAHLFFDEKQITVENHALGGTSPRTFYNKLWKPVLEGMRPGDYVVLELGHNDNGPIDENRARSSYKTSKSNGGEYDKFLLDDSTVVTVKEDGRQEKVFTFGGYMRRFVNEARAKGAIPILLTLTPRKAYEQDDTNRVDRKLTSFTPWIKAMAEELNTPLIDLNDISATKLEKYGKHKADYHFFGDKIHSSAFGAKMNAASFAEGLDGCLHPQVAKLKYYLKADMVHPKTVIEKHPNWVTTKQTKKVNGKKKKPRVFLAGDSTGKNADKDPNGMWGWGSQAASVFDGDKCTFVNCAMAGRSTRTFLKEGRWDEIYNSLEPGDYVLIQFGHNDMSGIDKPKFRGVIPVAQDTCHVYRMEDDGSYEVVYSFGWYLKKFIEDTREKGATPILLSLTPRNEWPNGKVERRNDFFGKLYRQVVEETGVDFIDILNITADTLDKMGKEKAAAMFNHDHTHTSLAGAQLNCQSLAKGLKAIKSPLSMCVK